MTLEQPVAAGGIDPVPGEWQRVSPKYVVVDLLGVLVSAVLFTIGTGVPWLLSGVTWLMRPFLPSGFTNNFDIAHSLPGGGVSAGPL